MKYASEKNRSQDEDRVKRRGTLTRIYDALPVAGSASFWQVVESLDTPLEVLVRSVRAAHRHRNEQTRDRLIELLIRRTQESNECWANSMLKSLSLHPNEQYALACDLCADLYERMLRAVLDPTHHFWEENVLHCIRFERQHVYYSLMVREGRWHDQQVKKTTRIPRTLLTSLDQSIQQSDNRAFLVDIEDEQARNIFLAIERSDLLQLVLHLPQKLKAVILLLFWEGRSEKETAQILQITDRTVRNRVQTALKLLRQAVEGERESCYE